METERELTITNTNRLILIFLSFISAAPFVYLHSYFKKLFWFGDELHLLTQLRQQGMWAWLFTPFAESFVPVFKLLWGGSVVLFNGNYFAIQVIVWLTHALNCFLLGRLLLKGGVSLIGVAFSILTFGLAWSNIETLGWTVQWSAILSITFFLLGWDLVQGEQYRNNKTSLKFYITYFLLLLFSTLSFARGVLSCAVLSIYSFLLGATHSDAYPEKRRKYFFFAGLSLIPAIAVTVIIFLIAGGNHRQIGGINFETIFKMIGYAIHVFLLNPFFHLFSFEGPPTDSILFLGTVKVFIVILSFVFAKDKSLRILILGFLLFDLGNAALLGLGRYHEGLNAAVSWRYQYVSLIGFLPSCAIVINQLFEWVFKSPKIKTIAAILSLVLWLNLIVTPWQSHIEHWHFWRGRDGRKALLKDNPNFRNWIGLPSIVPFDEGKETVRRFNLH